MSPWLPDSSQVSAKLGKDTEMKRIIRTFPVVRGLE
jgi:hypothetical protein